MSCNLHAKRTKFLAKSLRYIRTLQTYLSQDYLRADAASSRSRVENEIMTRELPCFRPDLRYHRVVPLNSVSRLKLSFSSSHTISLFVSRDLQPYEPLNIAFQFFLRLIITRLLEIRCFSFFRCSLMGVENKSFEDANYV